MILICTNYFVIFSCLVNRVELLTKYICNDELNFWISFPVHYFDVSMLITCLLELIKLDHILSTIFIIENESWFVNKNCCYDFNMKLQYINLSKKYYQYSCVVFVIESLTQLTMETKTAMKNELLGWSFLLACARENYPRKVFPLRAPLCGKQR